MPLYASKMAKKKKKMQTGNTNCWKGYGAIGIFTHC